jgi:N-methylhydantoinase A
MTCLNVAFPELIVSCSYEVANECREFERTSSVVLNAYITPEAHEYFSGIERELDERGFGGDLAILQSNGGMIAPHVAKAIPIRTVGSGPAGGVIGAQALGHALSEQNIICVDIGGTSCDVALIHDGEVLERYRTEVKGRPIIAPTVDITSIGAGGGSIAWVDDRGYLRVGPRSAGALPGPACFGFGGVEPTVTDCQLLLGRLTPDRFFGRRIELSADAAHEVVERLASALGMDTMTTAAGVIHLAETDMVYALRQVTVERGYDPRDFLLLAYGGAGGLFADALASHLEIPTVVIPKHAAVFSAWGMLFADYREDATLSRVFSLGASVDFAQCVQEVTAQAYKGLEAQTVYVDGAQVAVRADVRFVGQEHTLTVPVTGDFTSDFEYAAAMERTRQAFVERHRAEYGFADASQKAEVVALRASATGRLQHPPLDTAASRETSTSAQSSPPRRQVWFSNVARFEDAAIWQRHAIRPGVLVSGPAIIQEWNTTTVIGPTRAAKIDRLGNLILTIA